MRHFVDSNLQRGESFWRVSTVNSRNKSVLFTTKELKTLATVGSKRLPEIHKKESDISESNLFHISEIYNFFQGVWNKK